MENGIDTIIKENDKAVIKIGDRQYDIGKLNLEQTLKLTGFLAEIGIKLQDKIKKIDTTKPTIIDDVMSIVSILDIDQLSKFLSILLNEKDIEYCKTIPVENALDIVATVMENNDIDKLLKNVQRIARRIKEIQVKARETSSLS